MSENVTQGTQYLQSILAGFCVHEVKITPSVDERGVLYTIEPTRRDTPYVIGGKGITVSALRTLMRLWGQTHGDMEIAVLVIGSKNKGQRETFGNSIPPELSKDSTPVETSNA